MRSTTTLLAVTLALSATPCPGLAAAEAETETPAVAVPHDCGDSVDLPWRCVVIGADEVAPALTLFEGACFGIDTLIVAPWAATVKDGAQQATHFVVSGRELVSPCFPDGDAVAGLAALGLEPRASGSVW